MHNAMYPHAQLRTALLALTKRMKDGNHEWANIHSPFVSNSVLFQMEVGASEGKVSSKVYFPLAGGTWMYHEVEDGVCSMWANDCNGNRLPSLHEAMGSDFTWEEELPYRHAIMELAERVYPKASA